MSSSEGNGGWINTDAEKPLDEQIVVGYWPKNRYLAFPLMESLRYHADMGGDGDLWYDAHGEESDAPAYWRPQEAFPSGRARIASTKHVSGIAMRTSCPHWEECKQLGCNSDCDRGAPVVPDRGREGE